MNKQHRRLTLTMASFACTLLVAATALSVSFNSHAGTNTISQSCPLDRHQLTAQYTLTKKDIFKRPMSKQLTLWRMQNSVALQYPQQAITEVWSRNSNGRSRPVRYFDAYKRGIEYFPSEVKGSALDSTWQTKYQLIDDKFRQSMTLLGETGSGCQLTQQFELKTKGTIYQLSWQPATALVVEYVEQTPATKFTIVLNSAAQDDKEIAAFFAARQDYQTTDYADVGDNESDPFLRKMMNLGFVAHGASGFYTADGQKILPATPHVH